MPRIDCRPDQVFPELLQARLSIRGPRPDSPPELVAVVPLFWDWLGWERYAFAIPGGNSHVHLNLTCAGPKPDDFGLHFSLYGTEYAGGFLKPVRATADPLCWEFAIDVPGRSLARREVKIPLTIEIVPAADQRMALNEPSPWPVYLDSGWSSDDSGSGQPVVVESITATDLADSENSNSDISPAVGSPHRNLRVIQDLNGGLVKITVVPSPNVPEAELPAGWEIFKVVGMLNFESPPGKLTAYVSKEETGYILVQVKSDPNSTDDFKIQVEVVSCCDHQEWEPDDFILNYGPVGIGSYVPYGCVGLCQYRTRCQPGSPMPHLSAGTPPNSEVYAFRTEQAALTFRRQQQNMDMDTVLFVVQTEDDLLPDNGTYQQFTDPDRIDPHRIELSLYNFVTLLDHADRSWEPTYCWEWMNHGYVSQPAWKDSAIVKHDCRPPSDSDYNYDWWCVKVFY